VVGFNVLFKEGEVSPCCEGTAPRRMPMHPLEVKSFFEIWCVRTGLCTHVLSVSNAEMPLFPIP